MRSHGLRWVAIWVQQKRGAIKGPISIPLHSQLFLFNALAFPSIPSQVLEIPPGSVFDLHSQLHFLSNKIK
jgi:hypothetical protein